MQYLPNLAAKNDFPRSHLHHVQYYVTDYIPAAQTYVNTFPRPSLPSEWVWERDYTALGQATYILAVSFPDHITSTHGLRS